MTGCVMIAGCGYLGEEIAGIHIENGDEVHSITRTGTEIEGVQSHIIDLREPDIDPPDSDTLYYTVSADARTPREYRDAYVNALQNNLESTESENTIYTSSTGVYSQGNADWVDESTELEPKSERQRILIEAEEIALTHNALVARLGGIYGPGRWGVNRYLGDSEVLNGYTNRIRREDAARALVHLARNASPEEIYNVVDNEPVHRHTLADWLAKKTNSEPGKLAKKKPSTDKRVSNQKIRSTAWEPLYPSYKEGYIDYLDAQDQ